MLFRQILNNTKLGCYLKIYTCGMACVLLFKGGKKNAKKEEKMKRTLTLTVLLITAVMIVWGEGIANDNIINYIPDPVSRFSPAPISEAGGLYDNQIMSSPIERSRFSPNPISEAGGLVDNQVMSLPVTRSRFSPAPIDEAPDMKDSEINSAPNPISRFSPNPISEAGGLVDNQISTLIVVRSRFSPAPVDKVTDEKENEINANPQPRSRFSPRPIDNPDNGRHLYGTGNGVMAITPVVRSRFSPPIGEAIVTVYDREYKSIRISGLKNECNVRIYNIAGKLVKEENTRGTINAVNMPSGTYLMLMNIDGHNVSGKVMILK